MSGAHGHGHIEGNNKRIALLISVLALCLALVETLAKGAQTNALSYNIEAANLWSFFQAKTIRQTVVRTAGEMAELDQAPRSIQRPPTPSQSGLTPGRRRLRGGSRSPRRGRAARS